MGELFIECGTATIDYNPLRFNKGMLHKLDQLIPVFSNITQELKSFRKMLNNGAMDWEPNAKQTICL